MCPYITLYTVGDRQQGRSVLQSLSLWTGGHWRESEPLRWWRWPGATSKVSSYFCVLLSIITLCQSQISYNRSLWEGMVLISIGSRKAQPNYIHTCTWQVRSVLWLSINFVIFEIMSNVWKLFLRVALYYPNNINSLYHVLILLHCVCMYFRVNDAMKVKELISTARFARCRSRFVMPVILYENKVSMEYTVHYR